MQTEAFHGVFYLRPVFYVAVAFIIFFVLFGRRLFGAINGILDGRIATIKHELEEAARLRAEAEAMLQQAQAERRDAITQAQALIASAHDQAQRLTETLAADARLMAERREQMALDRIASAEEEVLTDLRMNAIDIATAAAEHVLAATMTLENDQILVDAAIAGMPMAMRAA